MEIELTDESYSTCLGASTETLLRTRESESIFSLTPSCPSLRRSSTSLEFLSPSLGSSSSSLISLSSSSSFRKEPARTRRNRTRIRSTSPSIQYWYRSLLWFLVYSSGRTRHFASNAGIATFRLPFGAGRRKQLQSYGVNDHQQAAFIPQGHSHNDYFQGRPLWSALQHGLTSIEVDVFPRNEQLWVAHTMFELDPGRRIENLYIRPLLAFLRGKDEERSSRSDAVNVPFPSTRDTTESSMIRGRTSVFNGETPETRALTQTGTNKAPSLLLKPSKDSLNLLVDFKGDAERSVSILNKVLEPLHPYLSRVSKSGKFSRRRLTVLISGNRPKEQSLVHSASGQRYLFIDGRESDMQEAIVSTNLVPMISIPWRSVQMHRMWGGQSAKKRMQDLADTAHAQGKILRIWGSPDDESVWSEMISSQVDLLSVDDHPRFFRFAVRNGLL